MILRVSGVDKSFAGLQALSGVSFSVLQGEIAALIGPNGAGKTTLFNVVTGVLAPDAGTVQVLGQDVTAAPPEAIARLGVARTFQRAHLFRTLTVLDNVMLGGHARSRGGVVACGLGLPAAVSADAALRERAFACLELVGIAEHRSRVASELPLGQQRYAEVARALAAHPRLLLLDEPTAGLNDAETRAFRDLVFRIRELGITVLVIEHHMKFVMDVSDRIVVLNFGVKIAEGPPTEIQGSRAVVEAYLGVDEDP